MKHRTEKAKEPKYQIKQKKPKIKNPPKRTKRQIRLKNKNYQKTENAKN